MTLPRILKRDARRKLRASRWSLIPECGWQPNRRRITSAPVARRKRDPFPPETLDALIKAGTVERTILASDLGQRGVDHPVTGFRHVIRICMKLGYSDEDIHRMISRNPIELLGI